jgi:hypothetical protein
VLAKGDDEWRLVVRQEVAVRIAEREDPPPFLEDELTNIIEALTQQTLGGLIEKEQVAALIGQEHWRGQPVGELSHQDQSYVALGHLRIVPELKPRIHCNPAPQRGSFGHL